MHCPSTVFRLTFPHMSAVATSKRRSSAPIYNICRGGYVITSLCRSIPVGFFKCTRNIKPPAQDVISPNISKMWTYPCQRAKSVGEAQVSLRSDLKCTEKHSAGLQCFSHRIPKRFEKTSRGYLKNLGTTHILLCSV